MWWNKSVGYCAHRRWFQQRQITIDLTIISTRTADPPDGTFWDSNPPAATHEYRQQFEQLLQAHRGIIYKVAGCYSRTSADRADVVQEICLQLWRAFPRYDRQRKFSTWMYRVAMGYDTVSGVG